MTFLPKKKKNPLVRRRKLAVVCVLVRLIGIGGMFWGLSALKPRPDQILFNQDGFYLLNVDGSGLEPLPIGDFEWGMRDFFWSPDGNYIAFGHQSLEDAAEHTTSIFIMDIVNRSVWQITKTPKYIILQGWSPDGQLLAVEQDGALFTMKPDGSELHPVSDAEMPLNDYPFQWSNDSSRIMFASDTNEGMKITIVNLLDGTTSFLPNSQHDYMPAWSPDNRQIAFFSPHESQFKLFLANADGTNRRVIAEKGGDHAWSSDGKSLVYVDEGIMRFDVETETVTRLTEASFRGHFPVWSPDSQYIVFLSNRDGDNDIYVMRADGSNVRQLTFNEWDDRNPQWRPR